VNEDNHQARGKDAAKIDRSSQRYPYSLFRDSPIQKSSLFSRMVVIKASINFLAQHDGTVSGEALLCAIELTNIDNPNSDRNLSWAVIGARPILMAGVSAPRTNWIELENTPISNKATINARHWRSDGMIFQPAIGPNLRTASERNNRERAVKIKLRPTSVPIVSSDIGGHFPRISTPRIKVLIPSMSTQNE
jgi:hypothetical protein